MEEVKINIPKGYVIDEENSTFECIKFKKIEEKENKRKELPKTWEEFCANNPTKKVEFFVNGDCIISKLNKGRQRNPIADANALPNKEYAEAMIALCQLIQLRDCYNEGWQPDWADRNQCKYCIIIYKNRIDFCYGYDNSHILAFRTPIIREMFYMNFKDIIEKAKILLRG